MNNQELSSDKIDVLREIGNIGSGHATSALASMLDNSLRMEVPNVKVMSFDDLSELVGGADTVVAAVLTHFKGDVSGMIMFILEIKEAKNLTGHMLHKTHSDDIKDFDYMDKSALKEVGNILMSSYLASINTLTNLGVRNEPPAICVDMAGSVLDYPIIELGKVGDNAIIIDSKFMDKDEPINGFLLFVADEESYEHIFNALGIGC
ncbi:MAG: chemotaxis protein CheC [Lachnospiraceae bacterium]|jgi:chemotaxis protein CheC|nr:chemotaxis protein CheC [Lachnospiraceae bacterium]